MDFVYPGRNRHLFNWRNLATGALQWLYPGLKIKRWLLLALAGLVLALLGFALLAGPDLYRPGRDLAVLLLYLRGSVYSGLILACGILLIVLGLQRATRAAAEAFPAGPGRPLIETLFTRRYLESGPRIVTIGGGTGLSVLLRELKHHTSNLTAVVTVTDDGGSSGRLRGELGILPPGDIRACLLALASTEPLMEKLFQHRFTAGVGLEGHSFGNLFIAAMTQMFGFQEAVKLFGQVLAIRGRVFPVTLDLVQLAVTDAFGRCFRGESVVNRYDGPLSRISLVPPDVRPLPEAVAAIADADAVVLGPGSLFTSVIPNLLVPGILSALLDTHAPVFYICNVMTQPGETTGFTAADHVQALQDHTAPGLLDYIIVNSDLAVSRDKLEPFHCKGADLVRPDYQRLRELAPRLISGPLIDHGFATRHNGRRLAQLIIDQTLSQPQRGRVKALGGRFYYFNSRIHHRLDRAGGARAGEALRPFHRRGP
jgi:uncharacterized cofD-like protein